MQKIVVFLLVAFASLPLFAQEQKGIDFRTDYAAAAELAKNDDKLLFFYFFVPDCPSCDEIEKEFDNKSLGKLYNDFYLSYALDASAGGKTLAENLGVFSFPTLLYIAHDGEVKYGTRGYRDGKSIFDTGKLARLSNKEIKRVMDKAYKANPKDTDHLYDYIEYQFIRNEFSKANKLLKKYLEQRADIEEGMWMNLVLDYAHDPDSYAYQVLLLERDKFEKQFGEDFIERMIWNGMISKLSQKYDPNNLDRFESKFLKEALDKGYDSNDEGLVFFYNEYLFSIYLNNYANLSDSDKSVLSKYALKTLEIQGHDFSKLHLIAIGDYVIRYHQNEKVLERLNEILDQNFEQDPYHLYLDLQSIVLYVLGKEDAAVEKIVAARKQALKQGIKNYEPSIKEFKRQGVVK